MLRSAVKRFNVYPCTVSQQSQLVIVRRAGYRRAAPRTSVDDNFEENLRLARATIELEKQRLLEGDVVSPLRSAPGWSEALADDGERVVKAEREPPLSIAELRSESVRIFERRRAADTVRRSGNRRSAPHTSVDDNFEENLRLARSAIELAKQDSLSGKVVSTISSAPGWSEELADDGEKVVKAEREPPVPIAELRKRSVRVFEMKRDQGGRSM